MKLRPFLFSALLSLAALCFPASLRAQFIGYTSPQTVSVAVFSGQNAAAVTPNNSATKCVVANGNPCPIPNLGQNMHFLSYTISGSPTLLDLRLEGSNDGVTFFSISDDAIDTVAPAGVLFAAGYYPVIRANLAAIFPNTASVTANYSGTSAVSSPPVGVYTTGLQTRKVAFTRASMGSNQSTVFSSPSGSTSGYLVIGPTSGLFPGGSSISVTSVLGNNTYNVALSATLGLSFGVFPVTGLPATSVSISYTSGGASGNDFSAWYVFSPAFPSVDPCASPAVLKLSAVATAPAAATTRIVVGSATAQTYVCGYQLAQTTAVGTLQWEYGTGATCGTGTTILTGAIPTAAGIPVTYGGSGQAIFTTLPPSNSLCLVTAGAAANAAGVVTYVQQP